MISAKLWHQQWCKILHLLPTKQKKRFLYNIRKKRKLLVSIQTIFFILTYQKKLELFIIKKSVFIPVKLFSFFGTIIIKKIGWFEHRTTKSGRDVKEETLDYIFVSTKNQFQFRAQILDFKTFDFKTNNGISISDHSSVYAEISTKCE